MLQFERSVYASVAILYIIIPQMISAYTGTVYLASNGQQGKPRSSTLWILQERTDQLVFTWTSFALNTFDYLEIELDRLSISEKMHKDATFSLLNAIGSSCVDEKYKVQASEKYLSVFTSAKEQRYLTYKRVPRIATANLSVKNQKIAQVQWKLEDKPCGKNDPVLIFKKTSTGSFEMHISSTSVSKYSFNKGVGDQEQEVFLTVVHKNSFSLPFLVSEAQKRVGFVDPLKAGEPRVEETGIAKASSFEIPWKSVLIGATFVVLGLCVCRVFYSLIKG
uniref:Uncharacterized protein n=1 Tax=Trichobilharzia regenti TaxID=157069 RepID=A0AA85J912_TRIRE|nr:unnamed protein product [Trichobilharzia regenti]